MGKFFLDYALARLKERSTWVGLISMAAGMGIHLEPNMTSLIATVGACIAGAVLMVTKDHKPVADTAIDTVGEIVDQALPIVKEIVDEHQAAAPAAPVAKVEEPKALSPTEMYPNPYK